MDTLAPNIYLCVILVVEAPLFLVFDRCDEACLDNETSRLTNSVTTQTLSFFSDMAVVSWVSVGCPDLFHAVWAPAESGEGRVVHEFWMPLQ